MEVSLDPMLASGWFDQSISNPHLILLDISFEKRPCPESPLSYPQGLLTYSRVIQFVEFRYLKSCMGCKVILSIYMQVIIHIRISHINFVMTHIMFMTKLPEEMSVNLYFVGVSSLVQSLLKLDWRPSMHNIFLFWLATYPMFCINIICTKRLAFCLNASYICFCRFGCNCRKNGYC